MSLLLAAMVGNLESKLLVRIHLVSMKWSIY